MNLGLLSCWEEYQVKALNTTRATIFLKLRSYLTHTPKMDLLPNKGGRRATLLKEATVLWTSYLIYDTEVPSILDGVMQVLVWSANQFESTRPKTHSIILPTLVRWREVQYHHWSLTLKTQSTITTRHRHQCLTEELATSSSMTILQIASSQQWDNLINDSGLDRNLVHLFFKTLNPRNDSWNKSSKSWTKMRAHQCLNRPNARVRLTNLSQNEVRYESMFQEFWRAKNQLYQLR